MLKLIPQDCWLLKPASFVISRKDKNFMGQPHERIVGGDEVDPKYSIPFQVTPPVRLNLRAILGQ